MIQPTADSRQVIDDKGRIRKTYPYKMVRTPYERLKSLPQRKTYPYKMVRTPYERLKSLPQAESCLRPGVTFEKLETITNQMSDNQFAERMVKARSNLFQQISRSAGRVA